MKRFLLVCLTIAVAASVVAPALAAPRLQTYIVDSKYHYNYNRFDRFSWVTNSKQFDLKVVGYWGADQSQMGSGSLGRDMLRSPAYDYMDCHLAMSVPTGQSGAIYVNGVEITAFNSYWNAVPAGASPSWTLPISSPGNYFSRYNFHEIGRIDNSRVNAWHYGHGRIYNPGWGDEILLNVVVRGFDWAHFGAIGVDSRGRTFTNSPSHDSSYHATPEPSTLSLLGLGLLGIAPLLRKKKR